MKRCAICCHKKRAEIEAAIIAGVSSYSTISRQYGVKVDCLKDHKRLGHLKVASLVAANAAKEKHGRDVADLIEECLEISLGSAREAREAKAYGSIGSIMAGPYKTIQVLSGVSSGDEGESGLAIMRRELKERRDGVALTPRDK